MMTGYPQLLEKVEARKKYEMVGQLGFFSGEQGPEEERLVEMEDFSLKDRLAMEKEVTGLYLSGHPLGDYSALSDKIQADKIVDLLNTEEEFPSPYEDGSQVTLLGIVQSRKEKVTKSGGRMGFVVLEDATAQIELLVFPAVYSRIGDLLKPESVVVVRGKLSIREEEEAKILCDQAFSVQEMGQQEFVLPEHGQKKEQLSAGQKGNAVPREKVNVNSGMTRKGLFLRLPSQQSPVFSKVINLISIFEGETPVYFRFVDTGKMLLAPRSLFTQVCPVLLSELERLVGKDSVRFLE